MLGSPATQHLLCGLCRANSVSLPLGIWYLVEVLHELQVALLTDQQVEVLLPVGVHCLNVSLQHKGGRWTLVGRPMLGVSLGGPPESACFHLRQTTPWPPLKPPRCSQVKARMGVLES